MTIEQVVLPVTVGEWLDELSPPPPPVLADRIRLSLQPHYARPFAELPDACLDAGEILLGQLLASGSTSRESALDLLTVDALVTYAFEIASTAPETFMNTASRAMKRIASFPAATGNTPTA